MERRVLFTRLAMVACQVFDELLRTANIRNAQFHSWLVAPVYVLDACLPCPVTYLGTFQSPFRRYRGTWFRRQPSY